MLFPFSLPLSLILIHILVTFLVIMTTNSILSERQRDELQVVRWSFVIYLCLLKLYCVHN